MILSAELRSKLLKRLQLQRESEDLLHQSQINGQSPNPSDFGVEVPALAQNFSVRASSSDSKARASEAGLRTWKKPDRSTRSAGSSPCQTLDRARTVSSPIGPQPLVAPDEEAIWRAEIEELEQRLAAANAERDKARQQQHHIEAAAVARSIELSAEVAKLRIDADVLQSDIEAAKSRSMSEPIAHSKVATTTPRCDFLEARVVCLEQEVASSIIERARLEGLLRQSSLRECQARRHLEAIHRVATAKELTGQVFALDHQDDEDDEDHHELDDLEFCYEEGLELSRLMPMQQALELVRRKPESLSPTTGCLSNALAGDPGGTPSTTTSSTAPSADEAAYEAPLRALELALAKLRTERAEGIGGEESQITTLGPERAEPQHMDDEFAAHLDVLTEVLQQLAPASANTLEEVSSRSPLPPNFALSPLSPLRANTVWPSLSRRFSAAFADRSFAKV